MKIKISELKYYPKNARQGDVGAIAESIKELGQFRSVVVNKNNNEILAGNHTVMAMEMLGYDEVNVEFVDVDEKTAKKIVLADNRISDLASYNDNDLAELLKEVAQDSGLSGTGFDDDDLDALLKEIAEPLDLGINKKPKGKRVARNLPIDLIYSYTPLDPSSFIAKEFGWLCGSISTESIRYVNKPEVAERFLWHHDIQFIDNDWKDYNHEKHLTAVKHFKPKYATTRDVMSSDQCRANDCEYYTFEQIMEFADDIAPHTENMIIIPKYNCIDKIPEDYVLGFSVPTSYGGTEVPWEAFKGRKVHLLGGSWKLQLQYLELLGDDVISLDNNYINKVSDWGQFTLPDGTLTDLEKIGFPRGSILSHKTFAVLLSLNNVAMKVNEILGKDEEE